METGIQIEFHLSYSENSVCKFFHMRCSFDISSGAKITIKVNLKKKKRVAEVLASLYHSKNILKT